MQEDVVLHGLVEFSLRCWSTEYRGIDIYIYIYILCANTRRHVLNEPSSSRNIANSFSSKR